MATYVSLNLAFLVGILLVLRIRLRLPGRVWWATLSILLLMTTVFDSLIIAAEIVGYDASKILGVYIGRAPIEDFFYAIAAAVLVPVLWRRGGKLWHK